MSLDIGMGLQICNKTSSVLVCSQQLVQLMPFNNPCCFVCRRVIVCVGLWSHLCACICGQRLRILLWSHLILLDPINSFSLWLFLLPHTCTNTHTHIKTHTRTRTHARTHARTHTHTHTHVLYAYWHVCTHSGTQRSVHTQAHTHTQSLLVCVHTLRYTQVCTHTSARTHMHIHKQTQTHTHTPGAGLLAWVRYTHVCILGTLAHTGKGMHALTQEVTCVHTQASHLAVMPGHAWVTITNKHSCVSPLMWKTLVWVFFLVLVLWVCAHL